MLVSIHHYELAPDASATDFREAVRTAERRDLFDLPGLVDYRFLRGIKGARRGQFTALWYYESRDAWEAIWGTVEDPVPPAEYPDGWQAWEELLEPILASDPDAIDFTTYEVLPSKDGSVAPDR